MTDDCPAVAAIRLLEELSLNAWPAFQTRYYDGWLMRFADGYTRRANSVLALYPGTLVTDEKIVECERAYTMRRQDTIFKITPTTQPADLDARLAARGYRCEAPTSVQVRKLTEVSTPSGDDVTLDVRPTAQWVEAFVRYNAIDDRHLSAIRRLLAAVPTEARFAALYDRGVIVAVALAILERGHVGLFDVVTAVSHRQRGLGTRLLLYLLRWANAAGAQGAYLQVMRDNTPALQLYAKLGYAELYSYWYRVRSPGVDRTVD